MRTWLLEYLVCPKCEGSLTLQSGEIHDDDVETGTLVCSECRKSYEIVRGVPRMAPDVIAADKQSTVDAFGWEWQTFDSFHDDPAVYDEQFLDWVSPLKPPFFNGKVVLDAGCGMGRFSAAAVHLGAERVIGVDLSESIEAARRFTRDLPNLALVQADIYNLPFRAPFDFAFSIGVVHHLPDPEAGFRSISAHVKPGGSTFVWVYGYENNGWIRLVVNPVREKITSKLPRKALFGLSYALSAALQPVLKFAYQAPEGSRLAQRLPYYPYLHWLSQFGFRHNHMVIFDHLVAPTAFYLKQDEFRSWFERAGYEDVTVNWRNQNSWRGFGRRQASPQDVTR